MDFVAVFFSDVDFVAVFFFAAVFVAVFFSSFFVTVLTDFFTETFLEEPFFEVSCSGSEFSLFLKAAPKISPREAPESDEPYSFIAFFSSAASRDFTDKVSFRFAVSTCMTFASIFSPAAKRSTRCPERSRDKSPLRIKPDRPSPTLTSRPPSATAVIEQVTVAPFLMLFTSPSNGSSVSCFIPREIRSFSTSTPKTLALTLSPLV